MAITKSGRSTLAQISTSGTTGPASIASAQAASFSVKHHNGSGTITAGATVQPQISYDAANWCNDGGPLQFGTTASTDEWRTYIPPCDGITPVQAVRFAYVVPAGSTGHTLDVEFATAVSP